MDSSSAERWVTVSALAVLGIYAYRRLTEDASPPVTLKKIVGLGNPVPLGSFATAWGVTFLIVAVMAQAAPGLGGGFAILIATSDFLTNAPAVLGDVSKAEAGSLTPASTTATGQTQVIAGQTNPNQSKGGAQIVAGQVTTGVGQVAGRVGGF